MVVRHAVGKVRKPFSIRGGFAQPRVVEFQTHLVVAEWSKEVGGLNQLSGHVHGVATVDEHRVERLEALQPRDAHHLNRRLRGGREVER